ncbi:MAG TPA: hypothetical protein ENJ29_11010 [Bacteroidetes bacterium]|nr:hypothetical protein [Bacteroidota bacterium]
MKLIERDLYISEFSGCLVFSTIAFLPWNAEEAGLFFLLKLEKSVTFFWRWGCAAGVFTSRVCGVGGDEFFVSCVFRHHVEVSSSREAPAECLFLTFAGKFHTFSAIL